MIHSRSISWVSDQFRTQLTWVSDPVPYYFVFICEKYLNISFVWAKKFLFKNNANILCKGWVRVQLSMCGSVILYIVETKCFGHHEEISL